MKIAIGLSCATLLLAGCAHNAPASNPSMSPGNAPPPRAIIKPDLQTSGQVAMVNSEARFVVLSFPPGPVPQPDQRLNVYRNGLKVGEVKVSGPQHENDTVADIVAGDVQVRDEVRSE
jgi:hypothetical protein